MILLTPEILARLPPLYATEHLPGPDKIAQAKLFTPWAGWTWYVVEYDPADRIAFGYVIGLEAEFGSFSLDELEAVRGPDGLRVERDVYFQPIRLGDIPDIDLSASG